MTLRLHDNTRFGVNCCERYCIVMLPLFWVSVAETCLVFTMTDHRCCQSSVCRDVTVKTLATDQSLSVISWNRAEGTIMSVLRCRWGGAADWTRHSHRYDQPWRQLADHPSRRTSCPDHLSHPGSLRRQLLQQQVQQAVRPSRWLLWSLSLWPFGRASLSGRMDGSRL